MAPSDQSKKQGVAPTDESTDAQLEGVDTSEIKEQADITVAPSHQSNKPGVDPTEESTDAQLEGVDTLEIKEQADINAAPSSEVDNFNDSGFFECEDFLLFPTDLPEVDKVTDKLIADSYASTRSESGSFYSDLPESAAQITDRISHEFPSLREDDDALLSDTVRQADQASINEAVYEAIGDYDTRSHPEYLAPATAVMVTPPLTKWLSTHHRHEQLAYQLEQPPSAEEPHSAEEPPSDEQPPSAEEPPSDEQPPSAEQPPDEQPPSDEGESDRE